MFKRYDASGDHLLQLDEFRSMLTALSPRLQEGPLGLSPPAIRFGAASRTGNGTGIDALPGQPFASHSDELDAEADAIYGSMELADGAYGMEGEAAAGLYDDGQGYTEGGAEMEGAGLATAFDPREEVLMQRLSSAAASASLAAQPSGPRSAWQRHS